MESIEDGGLKIFSSIPWQHVVLIPFQRGLWPSLLLVSQPFVACGMDVTFDKPFPLQCTLCLTIYYVWFSMVEGLVAHECILDYGC